MYRIEANFDLNAINGYIQEQADLFLNNLLEDWRNAGKKHIDNIREKVRTGKGPGQPSFYNHTFDLRSSIGYLLIYNGEIIEDYFPIVGGSSIGAETGKAWAREVGLLINERDGIQMIIAAGMDYAIYVESKGYDVISFTTEVELPKLLKQEIG